MVNGFFGQFKVNLDPKGRISLPARIRPRSEDGLSLPLIMTRGLDGCLALYTEDEWGNIDGLLTEQPFTRRDFRHFSRMLYSGAQDITPDSQGRFLIPSHLLQYAGLSQRALILGANRWIEIWNPERFEHTVNQPGGSFEEVAERLFGGGGQERG